MSASPAPRPIQPDGRLHGVVVACRRGDDRWLLIRRSATVAAPLRVCFPGGAVELGEPQPDAVRREMKEELGLDVTATACVWRWDAPDQPLTLWGWLAQPCVRGHEPGASATGGADWGLSPNPAEVSEVLWLTLDEAAAHPDGLPSTASLVAALQPGPPQPNGQ